jgi:hypothetical protein
MLPLMVLQRETRSAPASYATPTARHQTALIGERVATTETTFKPEVAQQRPFINEWLDAGNV